MDSDGVGKNLDNFSRGKWKKGQFIYRSRRSYSSVFDRDLFAHIYCGTRKNNDIHQDSKYGEFYVLWKMFPNFKIV